MYLNGFCHLNKMPSDQSVPAKVAFDPKAAPLHKIVGNSILPLRGYL